MAKYRKKPVEIEAFQYDGDLKGSDGNYYVPDWAVKAFEEGIMFYDSLSGREEPCELFINTLEGKHHVSVNDYVIQGINGELYPCKPDIFEKTYEYTGKDSADKKTNAGRIHSMSYEELAELFYSLINLEDKIKFCKNKTECEDILDAGKTIPDSMCKKCLVEWLRSEVEV